MSSREKLIEMLKRLRDACDALVTFLEEQEAEELKPITPQLPAPAVARPDIEETLPKTEDDRPLGWLIGELREEQAKHHLSYDIVERDDDYLVRVWIAADRLPREKLQVRRWIMWAKRTLSQKRAAERGGEQP